MLLLVVQTRTLLLSYFTSLDDDFLVLVRLGIFPSQVLSNFATTDGLLIDEESESVYLALSMAALSRNSMTWEDLPVL